MSYRGFTTMSAGIIDALLVRRRGDGRDFGAGRTGDDPRRGCSEHKTGPGSTIMADADLKKVTCNGTGANHNI